MGVCGGGDVRVGGCMGGFECLSFYVQTSFRRGFVPDCSLFCFQLIAFSPDLCLPAEIRSLAGDGAGMSAKDAFYCMYL